MALMSHMTAVGSSRNQSKTPVKLFVISGVPADLDPSENGPPGPNPLANMDRGVHIR